MAYLVSDTPTVTNTFTPAEVGSNIEEDFDRTTKENVRIKNTGDIKAYIRAKVVFTWQDEDGNVYAKKPLEGNDYNITWAPDGWTKTGQGDFAFYYYNQPVDAGETTGVLIKSCSPVANKAPDGYNLHVEILAEAIQAEPIDAVKDAWKVIPPKWESIN